MNKRQRKKALKKYILFMQEKHILIALGVALSQPPIPKFATGGIVPNNTLTRKWVNYPSVIIREDLSKLKKITVQLKEEA